MGLWLDLRSTGCRIGLVCGFDGAESGAWARIGRLLGILDLRGVVGRTNVRYLGVVRCDGGVGVVFSGLTG
jgi:hypothetical protein